MSYVSVRTTTLRKDSEMLFDIYVKIGEKYILYLRKTDVFEGERLERLKQKRLKKMFIQPEDEPKYRQYLDMGLQVLNDKTSSLDKKANVLNGMVTSSVEDLAENIKNEEAMEKVIQNSTRLIEFMSTDANAVKALVDSAYFREDLYQHASDVSSFAGTLAMKIGINKPQELEEIVLAGLLHDIGRGFLGIDQAKAINTYTDAEKVEFKDHPALGADMCSGNKAILQKSLLYIRQHEERINGKGFPDALFGSKIALGAQLIGLCSEFDIVRKDYKITSGEAWKKLMMDQVGAFELSHMTAMKEILIRMNMF